MAWGYSAQIQFSWAKEGGLLLFAGAGLAIYVAARAAVDVLARPGQTDVVRRAIGHWLPIAVVALAAAAIGRGDVAVGVVFASSVAALSLVTGILLVLSSEAAVGTRTVVWSFILPTALLALLAGFAGQLTLTHAAFLAIEGLAIIAAVESRHEPLSSAAPGSPAAAGTPYRVTQFILAMALAGVGAWAAIAGLVHVNHQTGMASTGLLSATLLSPILVLPLIGSATDLGQRGNIAAALSVNVTLALLNLCLLLPMVIGVWYARPALFPPPAASLAATQPATMTSRPASRPATEATEPDDVDHSAANEPPHLAYPMAVWRIDTVFLVAIGFFLVPISMGRWTPGRREGFALIIAYAVYVLLSTALSGRGV